MAVRIFERSENFETCKILLFLSKSYYVYNMNFYDEVPSLSRIIFHGLLSVVMGENYNITLKNYYLSRYRTVFYASYFLIFKLYLYMLGFK